MSGAAMGRFGRWLGVGLVVTAAAAGCAFGKKPYAADPLLTHRRGTWGDWEKAADPDRQPPAEPAAPAPPAGPLLGTPLLAVTSPP